VAVLFANPRRSFYYGSIAKGDDTAASDIDLMVISDRLTYPDLFAALEKGLYPTWEKGRSHDLFVEGAGQAGEDLGAARVSSSAR